MDRPRTPDMILSCGGNGSWLCKNAKTLNRDRRIYSSKTAFVAQLASEFNLAIKLKKIILFAFRFFEFVHSQGQKRKSRPCGGMICFYPVSRHRQAVSACPKTCTQPDP